MSVSVPFSGAPGTASDVNIALPAPPGGGGATAGPSNLILHALTIGLRQGTAADAWEIKLLTSIGGTVIWRSGLPSSTSVNVASAIHFVFPNNTGPQVGSATPYLTISRFTGSGTLSSYVGTALVGVV